MEGRGADPRAGDSGPAGDQPEAGEPGRRGRALGEGRHDGQTLRRVVDREAHDEEGPEREGADRVGRPNRQALAERAPSPARLAGDQPEAGGPAIPGAWIGASAFHPSLAAFLLGMGVGAIVQVIQQLAPTLRDGEGRALGPLSVAGIVTGALLMYATSLLVSV